MTWISDPGIYMKDRVVSSTERVLALLEDSGAQATFFILGYVAERHPNLVEKIRGRGHEIAYHGYAHKRLTAQSPQEFEEDLIKSLGILQGITGADIWGYRAPQFCRYGRDRLGHRYPQETRSGV